MASGTTLKSMPSQRDIDQAMAAKFWAIVPLVNAASDFSQLSRIADLGAGHGHLLSAILKRSDSV